MKISRFPLVSWPGAVCLASVAFVAVLAAAARLVGQDVSSEPVTFTKDIAPILQRSCQRCHRPGGGAPMSLVTYDEVRPWARAIRQRTALREMPPWFIEKTIGIQQFQDDPSLSDREIAVIGTWADNGAVRGDSPEPTLPRELADANGWRMGTPDVIVSSPEVTIAAVAPDLYTQLDNAETGLTEDRYVKAVEIKEVMTRHASAERPSRRPAGELNGSVVHHAHISVTRTPWKKGDPVDDGDGIAQLNRGGFYVVHELGQNPMIYPDELGVKLTAGSALTFFDMHLHSIGEEVSVRLDVALKFHPKGYKPKYLQAGEAFVISGPNLDLDIPGGKSDVVFETSQLLKQPVRMLTFEPHLHASGKRMCVEATYPNGYREMINCAGYNHNWVNSYVYQDDAAPLLPAGTVVHVTAWYDNTPKNPRVVDPRNWRGWGERSIDDMFYLLNRAIILTEPEYQAELAARAARHLPPHPGTLSPVKR